MAYLANAYYPEEMKGVVNNAMVRTFAIIIAVAAAVVFLLDYFLKVFSKTARQP